MMHLSDIFQPFSQMAEQKLSFLEKIRASRLTAKGYLQISQVEVDLEDIPEKVKPKKRKSKLETLLSSLNAEQLQLVQKALEEKNGKR